MADQAQNGAPWVPSVAQAAVLEAAKDPGVDRTIVAICGEAGVSRTAFYSWMREDPGFKAKWDGIWIEALDTHFAGIVAAVVKKAQAGGVGAARLAAELKGVLSRRIELTGRDGGPVRTIDLSKCSPEQLDALIALDPSLASELKPGGG